MMEHEYDGAEQHLLFDQELMQKLEAASLQVRAWPAWKQGLLELCFQTTNARPRDVDLYMESDWTSQPKDIR